MNTIDASGNIHDPGTGQFAGHVKGEADPEMVLTIDNPVEQVPVAVVLPGDTVWVDGNPVQVAATSQPYRWQLDLIDTNGRSHQFTDLTAMVHRSRTPLAPFDDIDWTEACEFDDWESEHGQIDTMVRYNADGFGEVSATLTGMGGYRFHGLYHLGLLGDFDENELLPDGRTKGEALDTWVEDVVMNAVDEGIRERYGWDMVSGNEADSDVRPQVWATNTEPGPIDADTAAKLLWPAQARFINESDPGTWNAEYPYAGWVAKAVAAREAQGLPARPW